MLRRLTRSPLLNLPSVDSNINVHLHCKTDVNDVDDEPILTFLGSQDFICLSWTLILFDTDVLKLSYLTITQYAFLRPSWSTNGTTYRVIENEKHRIRYHPRILNWGLG